MAASEWLRTFLAVYRAGAVTAPPPALRFGSTAEFFSYESFPASIRTARCRSVHAAPIGTKRFVLAGAPGIRPSSPVGDLAREHVTAFTRMLRE